MAYFKDLMAFPVFFPQEERAVRKYGDKYGTASKYMAYNGPFLQKGWSGSNLSWKLVKNPDYWDKDQVKLDRSASRSTRRHRPPTTSMSQRRSML